MNKLIFLLLIILSVRSFSQTRPESVERKNYDCWASIDHIINIYSDSLNFCSIGRLPDFIYEVNLDHSLIGFSRDCFIRPQFISFRRAILERVVNEEVLNAVAKSKDARLDEIYNPHELERTKKEHPSIHGSNYPELPYMKYSTKQLAEMRLKELLKTKRLLKKQ